MKEYNAKIVSIPVDNAARHVAVAVATKLGEKYPGMKVIVTRDPAHCIDLLMKDLAKTGVINLSSNMQRKSGTSSRLTAVIQSDATQL